MIELLDRPALKRKAAELLQNAQVSPKAMTALYMGLVCVLSLIILFAGDEGILATFLNIFVTLLSSVLSAGFVLYCMTVRQGVRAEFPTLFDGFSFAGKLIMLDIAMYFFIFLWSMLFVIPGIIAAYRYQFAVYNLCENPGLTAMEALEMSKRQTYGYKGQLFFLDLSYIGWTLLSGLPNIYFNFLATREIMLYVIRAGNPLALPEGDVLYAATGLSPLVRVLIAALWSLAVSLFYLPNRVCVELDYFEAGKRTSGVPEEEHRPIWSD